MKPVGVAFAEINLDSTPMERGLKKANETLTEGTIKVENAYKSLGIKSDQVFNMMKANATAAVEFIKNKTLSSLEEIYNAEKAASTKIAAINAQQFAMQRDQYSARVAQAKAANDAIAADRQLLGVRTTEIINAEKAAIEAAYLRQKEAAAGNARDLIVLEEAKNAKMLALTMELHSVKLANNAKEVAAAEATATAIIATQEKIRAQGLMQVEAGAMDVKRTKDMQEAQAQGIMTEMEWQKKMEATKSEAWAENARRTREQGLMQIQATKDDVERTKKAQQDKIAATNENYAALGMRSAAAIKEQIANVNAAAAAEQAIKGRSSEDWIRIERAKNAKLKELNKEMTGEHEMSMASMTRAVLRFYAAYYIISTVIGGVGRAFMSGVKAIDDMQLSAVTVAATITNIQGTSGDVVENYKKNLEYAKGLVPVLMQIDAASLANLEQVQLINNALAMHGVILDGSNKKQVASMTALTNTIAIFTKGQNQTQQSIQETNAALNGEVTSRNRLALMLDQQIKRQGDYKDGLKGLNIEAQKHGDWLERIAPYLVGINAATGDISKTWEAVKTSLQTTWMILQTEIFKDFYKGLVTSGQEAIGWARENAPKIGEYFRASMNAVGDAIGAAWGVLKGFGPLLKDLAPLVSAIAYGWGGVLAVLKPIGEFLGNSIALTYELVKMIGNATVAIVAFALRRKDVAKVAWDEAKNSFSKIEDLSAKNKKILTIDTFDAIAAYDKQYQARKKAEGTDYVPKVPPGGKSEEEIKKAEDAAKRATDEAKRLKEAWDATALSLQQKIDTDPLDDFDKALKNLEYEIEKLRKQPYANKALIDTYQLAEETKIITKWQDDFNKRQVRAAEEYQRQEEAKAKSIIKGQEAVDRVVRDSAKEQERLQKEANARQVEMYKTVANAIHNSFATMFEDLFSGATNSFRKMGDSILSIFRRMLAQMATLAIARPIIVPIVSAMGSVLGVESATAGTLKEMGISGAIASSGSSVGGSGGVVSNVGYGAAGAGFLGEISGILPSLQSTVTNSGALIAAHLAGEEAGAATGQAIANLSTEAFSAWTAGITTFISRLLQGQDFGRAAQSGLGAAGGAYVGAKGGAAIGSYFGPVGTAIGAFVGAIAGGFLGALGVDKLFSSGENEFTLTELVNKEINAQIFDKVNGFKQKNWDAGTVGNDWYIPIANAYAASIETIQQSFNTMVFDFTSKLPKEMQSQILNELASADFAATLTAASLGRYNESEASTVLAGVAKNYAEALAKSLGNAYANALGDYVSLKGGAGLIGDTAAWAMLTDRVQDNINKMFKDIGAQIKGGDTEGGLKAINDINSVIDKIGSAMAPITEIIATKGMTDYELQLRAINKQFDDYGKALEEAGVDLTKYTDLETARQIELAKAANTAAGSIGELTKSLLDQRDTITQWLSDMNRSPLAPSNSMQAIQAEYNRQKGLASATGASTTDVSNYLNYAKEYLDYMKKYGGDYKAIYGGVMSDVGGLKEGIDLQLDAQLAAATALSSAAALLGSAGSALIAAAAGQAIVNAGGTAEEVIANTTTNQDVWDWDNWSSSQTLINAGLGGYADGGYHEGGWRVVGERGPELEFTPPSRIFNNKQTKTMLDNLGLNGGSNGPGGDVTVHAHFHIDGKEIGDVVTKQISRNGFLKDEIRRAAN